MKERLLEVLHYRKNLKAPPDGNSLCYRGEKDGHGQIQETPLIEDGFMPDLFKVFPSPFNAGEIIRRNYGTTKK